MKNVTCNEDKCHELVKLILVYAKERSLDIDFWDVMDMIALVDTVHLNSYGHPLTGDIYVNVKNEDIYKTLPLYCHNVLENYDLNKECDLKAEDLNLELFSEEDISSIIKSLNPEFDNVMSFFDKFHDLKSSHESN